VPDEQTITITLPDALADRLHDLATYASFDLSTTVAQMLVVTDATMTLDETHRLHADGTIDDAEKARRYDQAQEMLTAGLVALRPKPPASYNPN
jgi:hypothetical protein